MREAQVSRSPILESFNFRVFATRLNLKIFRVSRVFIDSVNRPINTEKYTQFWRKIYGSQGSDFSSLSFSFILFYEDD
jgi:hypothetical protein